MRTILEPSDLLKAITASGRNGKPAARIVTAKILFTEDGAILTYTVENQQLHIKRGGDIASLILLLSEGAEEEPTPTRAKRPT